MSTYMHARRRLADADARALRRDAGAQVRRGVVFPFPTELEHLSLREIAATSGVPVKTVFRWRAEGLSLWQADRLAIAWGTHPCLWWPEWWDLAALETEQLGLWEAV